MNDRLHIRRKALSQPDTTPDRTQFYTSRQPGLAVNQLQSNLALQAETDPSVKTQQSMEQASGFGHEFSRISVRRPQPKLTVALEAIQRRTVCDENGEGCYEVDDDQSSVSQEQQPVSQDQLQGKTAEFTVNLPPPETTEIPNLGYGDFPKPDKDIVMAKPLSGVIQRDGGDDDQPKPGLDVGVTPPELPFTLAVTGVCRNCNLFKFKDFLGEAEIGHELQAQLSIDRDFNIVSQVSFSLFNQHLQLNHGLLFNEVELALMPFLQITPDRQGGAQAQAQIHIYDQVTVDFTLSGTYIPSKKDSNGYLQWSGGVATTLHFDL